MDELIPSVPRTAAELTGEEGPGLYSALIGAGMGAGMGLIGGGGPVGAVVGGIVGGMGGMGWLDFLGRPTRTLLHTGDTGQAWESIWDSSKASTEQDLLNDIGYQPMDQGEGFDFGDVADFVARAGVGMATDPLTFVNPGALTAKGALRKTAGYNTLGKYFKAQNELRASAKTLGLSPRELEESLGTAANRIANEHNAEMLARESAHGLESGALGRLESPYVREYTGVSSEPFDVAMGPKASQWKQVKTIEQQLGNFGLGETLAERVKRGEQWTLGFGLPWGQEKSVGIQMDTVVDYLSDKGSTLEQAIGATGTGRWVTDKIRTAREYIFNPIRENAFEELKRQSQNIPWKMLKGIEADHSKLFEDIQGKKLNADEYAALTELASWDRLAKAGNEYAAAKAADARKAFTSPERAAWAAGAADKLRDLETRLLDAMQQGGVDVQDMRSEILNRHAAFQSKAERLQEEYLLTKGEYASAKMKMDQAADTAHRAVWDDGVRYSDEVNTYKAEVQRTEIEGEAKKRFEDTVKRYARETKGSKEEIEKRSAEVSLGIRKMAKAWQEKTGGNLTDFYKDHMPTDSETLTEWAKLGRAKETPGASVSATTTTEVVAHPSPGAPGTTTPQTFEDVLRLRESATPAASSDFQSRLSAVKTTEDTSESIKWAIDALKKAKDASEAEVIVKGVPKDERPELAMLLGLDPKKILTPQVKAEFTRAPKSGGASVGRGAGGADEQVAKISEQSAKEFIENKPVVKVDPVNDTEVAHSLFRTLPAAEKESIISRISNKQVETTDQWLARRPPVDANYEASMREWQNKAPYKQNGETADEFSERFAEWQSQKPGSAEYNQWLKEKPQESVVPINRDGYDAYHSYVQDPKRMQEARMAAEMDTEAAAILKRQAEDYVRVKRELPQDAEMRALLDRLKNSDDAAPAPSVAPVTMKKPERRVYDKIEGVGKVKQPWQMTAQEWSDYVQNAPDKSGELIPISRIVDEHVSSIKNAINRGEVVSPKVLESYQEVADFAAPRVEYIGEKGTAQAYKTADGGLFWQRNQENLQRVPYEKSMSAKAVAEYMDLQAKVLQKTKVLGEKARALEIAERSQKQFEEMLDKTPEHLHAMLTPEALDSLVKNKTFQRALAGGDKGLLRKFTMVGRPLSLVEMNQLVKEQDRAGQLLALGGALPKGKLSLQDLVAAMHPDDATYTQWAKHSLPVGASDAQIAKKATELKALPPQQRIRAVSEAYGKLFDERPEVAMAASIENASKLISNAQFNDGLKNLFTRRAPTIKLPEAELKETLEHNKQITAEIKSSNDQLSQIGRDMKAAKKDLKSKDPNVASAASEKLNALKEERKQVREELKLLEDQKQPTHKVGLSAQEPSGERWVSAEGLGPQFKGREMKEGVYNQAVRYLEMKNSPMAFQGLMELMRTPTRWYKQMQLSWPGSWFRDAIGNKMLRLQNQGFHSQTLMDSPKLIKVLTSNGDEKALKDIVFTFDNWQGSKTRKTITGKEMWDFATENGIHGVDQYAIEIGKQIRGKGGVVSKAFNKVMGTPRQLIQDMDRLEMFHARLSHGDAVGEAAARTNLALYDYRSVSPFVDMMRTSGIMPFATWTAKNIPAQFELFIKHPGQFAAMMHAKAAVEQGVPGVSDKDLPAYVDKKFNIILGKTADGKVWFRTLSGVVPMADLPTLGKMSVGDFLQDALGPLPKIAIEEITNRDSYSGRMIQKYDGQLSPLSDHVPVLKDVLVPVRAKRRLQVAIGRPLSVAEEFMSWSSSDAEGSLQRPKSFMQRNALVGALIGVGPVETDPRMNALQRQKDKQAEVNRALSDAAYYRKRGQFDAAEAAQKRAAELQRQR